MNRLSKERSAYLKHSAYQKIEWYPWSDEAFERAKQEDKPVFLSSGAIWCHWCHVMAKECFENEDIIRLLNENFICIKLDRDERPDIDRRYQQAVSAIGSGGGWPLSVFLTPDRKPFFGGTYFPPEDSSGRPGFKRMLKAIAEFYKTNRGDVSLYADKLLGFIKQKPMPHAGIEKSMPDAAAKRILSEFDPQNGGFGAAPKFPMHGAMEFMINRYFFTRDESIGYAVKKSLEGMAKGGFHDHLGGGFHRYSTDEAWIIPHFEKMADDNAWLLRNYIDAYNVFGDDYFKEVAEGIIKFIKEVLSAPEGGFYASQDADVTPDDEGGYFTWTEEEFKNALNAGEYPVLSMHLFHERGSMHHNPEKKVLFDIMNEDEISVKTGLDKNRVREIIQLGRQKLLNRRLRRETPFIDKNFYTSLNGMLISAYLKAFRALKEDSIKEFALKSLDMIMNLRFTGNELFHSEGVKAMLDDYVYMIEALASAYEVTGDSSYLHKADGLMGICLEKFRDKNEGGFFDTDEEVLGLRLKGIEDIPHPSANSLMIMMLLKLYQMTNKSAYIEYAEQALRTFSARARDMGIHAGYYYAALDAYFNMLKLTVYASPEGEPAKAAVSTFRPYMTIAYEEDRGYILPCLKSECYEPVYTAGELKKFLNMK